MRGLIEAGRDRLNAGAAALDVVVETIQALEASGFYVSGRGASPNTDGIFELDASLMHGPSRRAGAVATLVGFKSPITAARAVMEKTSHVMLAGSGAAAFAAAQGLEPIADPDAWFTPAWRELSASPDTGTVGCLALDERGELAAGTSTGGVFGKRPGRVGDSPIPGAGMWADDHVAVSCTGQGEMFIRAAVAALGGGEAGESSDSGDGWAQADAAWLGELDRVVRERKVQLHAAAALSGARSKDGGEAQTLDALKALSATPLATRSGPRPDGDDSLIGPVLRLCSRASFCSSGVDTGGDEGEALVDKGWSDACSRCRLGRESRNHDRG